MMELVLKNTEVNQIKNIPNVKKPKMAELKNVENNEKETNRNRISKTSH